MFALRSIAIFLVLQGCTRSSSCFSLKSSALVCRSKCASKRSVQLMAMLEGNDGTDQSIFEGVVELADSSSIDSAAPANPVPNTTGGNGASLAPFLSQGEIDPEAMNPDLSDPKQARVIFYIILSLVPVLFLIPLMIGSRELIPLDAVPPVQM